MSNSMNFHTIESSFDIPVSHKSVCALLIQSFNQRNQYWRRRRMRLNLFRPQLQMFFLEVSTIWSYKWLSILVLTLSSWPREKSAKKDMTDQLTRKLKRAQKADCSGRKTSSWLKKWTMRMMAISTRVFNSNTWTGSSLCQYFLNNVTMKKTKITAVGGDTMRLLMSYLYP